jgi:hypothetical protein
MTDEETSARAAIARTLAACTQAGDARKADAYAQCFTEDGVLELGTTLRGREAIRRFMSAPSVIPPPAGGSAGHVSHHLTTCRIDLTSADIAAVRTYWFVISVIGVDHSGYYDDRFVRTGAEWLIASRRPRTLWKSPHSLVARQDPT